MYIRKWTLLECPNEKVYTPPEGEEDLASDGWIRMLKVMRVTGLGYAVKNLFF